MHDNHHLPSIRLRCSSYREQKFFDRYLETRKKMIGKDLWMVDGAPSSGWRTLESRCHFRLALPFVSAPETRSCGPGQSSTMKLCSRIAVPYAGPITSSR